MNAHRRLALAACAASIPALVQAQQEGPPDTAPAPVPQQPDVAADDEVDLGVQQVTARKWTEDPLFVPESVTAFSGDELEDAGLATVREAALLVPNVNLTEFSARRLSFPFVRGIGSGQGEAAVTTYVDGVPQLSTGSTNLPLVDLERVEFLRGPQGTLYGRNSIGGVIKLETRRPTDQHEFEGAVNFGNYDLFESRVGYSGPLSSSKELYLDVSALYSERDGYTTNLFTGDRVDSREGFFGRAQVFYRPNEHNELRVGMYGETDDDGSFALSDLQGLRENPNTINQDFQGTTERDVLSPSMTYQHYGSSMDFVSVTAFTTWDVDETSDFDFTTIDGIRRTTAEAQDTIYQEFRLQSAEGEDHRLSESWELRWLAGVSGFVADSDRSAANDFRPGGAGILFPPFAVGTDTQSGEFDDLAGAVFGQTAFIHDEKLELAVGLRLDVEDKEASLERTFDPGIGPIPVSSGEFSETYDEPVPKFSVAYHFDPTGQVYTYAAKGFQAGGFNLAAPPGDIPFDSETSWTYEVGAKKALAEGRVRLAASLFYTDWDDQQVSLFDQMSGGFVDNVGESTSHGAELEAAATVVKGFDMFGSVGLTNTEIEEWVDPFGQDVEGNELPFAPSNTWAVGGQYRGRITDESGWYARAEFTGVGEYFYDAGNLEAESYQICNLRLGFTHGPLKLEGWVKNVFDDRYIPVAFQPNPGDPTQFVGESGAPRTFGVSLSGSI